MEANVAIFPMSVTSPLPNACVETLTPPYDTIGGAVCGGWLRFGKCFDHEGGDLLNRITALMKEIPGGSLASSAQAVNQARAPIRMRTCWCLDLGTPSLQNCETLIYIFYQLPTLWFLL